MGALIEFLIFLILLAIFVGIARIVLSNKFLDSWTNKKKQ